MSSKFFRFNLSKKERSADTNINSPAISYAGLSDKGLRRSSNQDSWGIFPVDFIDILSPQGCLFIIADGVGGHSGGREASGIAKDTVQQEYFSNFSEDISKNLLQAFENANLRIYQKQSAADPMQKMGTTCSALVLAGQRGYTAHIGDSRIYRIRGGVIEQLTQDHSEAAKLAPDYFHADREALDQTQRFVLSRAMGTEPNVKIDVSDIPLQNKDFFILSTDGLAKVSLEEIKTAVLSHSPESACEKLVNLANQLGGQDNVTVLVIQIHQVSPP